MSLLTLAGLVLAANATGGAELIGSVARVAGPAMEVSDLTWQVVQDQDHLSLAVQAVSAQVVDIALTDIAHSCAQLHWHAAGVDCTGGRISMTAAGYHATTTGTLDWQYRHLDGRVSFSGVVALWGGTIAFAGDLGDTWAVTGEISGIALSELVPALGLNDSLGQTSGRLSARFSVDDSGGFPTVQGTFTASEANFDAADGSLAGAEVTVEGEYQVALHATTTHFTLAPRVISGELLLGVIYLPLDQLPDLLLSLVGQLSDAGTLLLERFEFSDGDSVTVHGKAEVAADGRLTALSLEVVHLLLENAFGRYFSSGLDALGWAGLSARGSMTGDIRFDAGSLQHMRVSLRDVDLIDDAGRIAGQGIQGRINYRREGTVEPSALTWDGIDLYRVALGPANARASLAGSRLQLLDPLELAIFDGALRIDEFAIDGYGSDDIALDFQGELQPIGLQNLSEALDWPPLSGTLSGRIPRVSLRDGVLEVGGAIDLEVFDGQVKLSNLRLERLLGVLPTLAADIQIDNIDLNLMTTAFSFGRIEGRLEGAARGLRLLDWQPVAFDLRLSTPKGDRSRHRISQRAVDNLSNIGGGIAAISQTFLRFFEDFSYRELGLRCRLVNDVCTMGGVGPAGRGYYIVKGSGIPRIDIVGYSEQVNWPQLVARLQAATRGGAPSVR